MGKQLFLTLSLILLITGIVKAQVPPPPTPVCSLQVVFHILHQNGPENIGDSQVIDAMRILNEDFSHSNADTANIIPQFTNIAADCRIQFHLATIDPQGNATNGIDRIVTALTDSADDHSKINQWPPNRYVNIWVAKSLQRLQAGTAYLPDTVTVLGSQVDGIMMLHNYVGSIGTSNAIQSRALTQEAGRYLGLIHPWGDNNGPEVACGDDSIADTPVTSGYEQCPADTNHAKICHPAEQDSVGDPGVVENYQNFMEYSYCSCMFTAGQAAWMHNTLQSTVANRNQLCGAIGVGIEETVAVNNELTMFPNPATSSVQLSYQLAKESIVKIEVFDALGRNIKTIAESKEPAGTRTLTIDTKSFPQGVYVIKMAVDGVAVSKRLVVGR